MLQDVLDLKIIALSDFRRRFVYKGKAVSGVSRVVPLPFLSPELVSSQLALSLRQFSPARKFPELHSPLYLILPMFSLFLLG